MTCRELIAFLMDYCDGALTAEQRAVFEEHLAVCPPCVAYLETYRQTIALGKSACRCDEEHAVREAPPELIEAILEARTKQ